MAEVSDTASTYKVIEVTYGSARATRLLCVHSGDNVCGVMLTAVAMDAGNGFAGLRLGNGAPIFFTPRQQDAYVTIQETAAGRHIGCNRVYSANHFCVSMTMASQTLGIERPEESWPKMLATFGESRHLLPGMIHLLLCCVCWLFKTQRLSVFILPDAMFAVLKAPLVVPVAETPRGTVVFPPPEDIIEFD